MQKVKSFYSDLYTKGKTNPYYEEIVSPLGPGAIKKCTQMELENIEKQITMDDLSKCLVKTRNNVLPGSDSFLGLFYKVFCVKLKHLVLCAVHYEYSDKFLPPYEHYVIGSVIPKSHKDLILIQSWNIL